MTKPLTKEQRAEMRERFMLGEYTPEDVQDMFERLDSRELVDEALENLRSGILEVLTSVGIKLIATLDDNGKQINDDDVLAELKSAINVIKFEAENQRDLTTAKLATAEVCEKCSKGLIRGSGDNPKDPYWKKCPHCTNGIVFSDERARELLQKAKERDEAYDYGSRLLKCIWPEETHPDFEVLPDMLGLMIQLDHTLAARAKEGKE